MFGKTDSLIGLDIGSGGIKVVELEDNKKGYSIKSIGYKELPRDAISEGSVVDMAEVVNSINEVFKQCGISNNKVAIALKGNAVIAKRVHVPAADESVLEEEFRYQVQQFIQMDIEDVNIDYHIVETDINTGMTDVILAVARKDLISSMLSLLHSTKLKVAVVDLEVFALANIYELNYGVNSDVTAILNIGHSSSLIVFIKNGYYEFSREMSIGGKDCIEMVQKRMGMTYDEARAMICDNEAVEFNEDLQKVIADFNAQLGYEIKHSVEIFYSTAKYSISKLYLCGGLSKLFGVKGMVEKALNVSVLDFNPFLNIDITDVADSDLVSKNPYLFNTAVGLALRKVKDR